MRLSLLCWFGSFLTLHSGSSSAVPPSITELPNEMQLAILERFVVSQKVDFCGHVDWLAVNRWAYPHTDVGMAMLKEIAEEEWSLYLDDDTQRVRKQQILRKVRTFVRIRSRLPIVCKTTDEEELEHLAQVLESTYRDVSSFSESPTWKKACMAGLFGRNTLIKLLPYLSQDFCSDSKDILLQTACFIGDIDSVDAIIGFFSLSKDEVLEKVPEIDIVFSGSVPFLEELVEFLPDLVEKRLSLIREACYLNRLDIFTFILEVAKPVEPHELDQILDSFWKLKMFKNKWARKYCLGDKQLCYFLTVAAQHGYVPIIRFLWPRMATMSNGAETIIEKIMTAADRNDHRGVLEFLLLQSGEDYMKIAQKYVNDAFKAAIRRGNVNIIALLTGKNNDGTFVFPGLCLPTLDKRDFEYVIKTNKKWDGIKYLVRLKEEGDPRFADFELVDQNNTALCMACEVGNYEVFEYLLDTTDDGEFVFPRTHPVAQNGTPLVNACGSGNLQIVEKLLERDVSGDYIYKGINPSAQDYRSVENALRDGHVDIVEFLLKRGDGKYVLPGMNGVDVTSMLRAAIEGNQKDFVKWLLRMNEGEEYVLPGMNSVDFTRVLSNAIMWYRRDIVEWLLRMNESGEYVLPGMNGVDLTRVLESAIECNQMKMLRFLLKMEDGEYVLPGMNSVDFTQGLEIAIKWNEMEMVRFLLKMEDGKYVLPGMNSVDLTRGLESAIRWNQIKMVQFLLKMEVGEYVLPGIRVTEEMLGIEGQSHEIRQFLARNLERQRIDA